MKTTLVKLMSSGNKYQQCLNKVGVNYILDATQQIVLFFRTGLVPTHQVFGGDLVPAGSVLVTPGQEAKFWLAETIGAPHFSAYIEAQGCVFLLMRSSSELSLSHLFST